MKSKIFGLLLVSGLFYLIFGAFKSSSPQQEKKPDANSSMRASLGPPLSSSFKFLGGKRKKALEEQIQSSSSNESSNASSTSSYERSRVSSSSSSIEVNELHESSETFASHGSSSRSSMAKNEVPMGKIIAKGGNRKCVPPTTEWFVDGDFPGDPLKDYAFGMDPKEPDAAFLKSIKPRPEPHAQLNRCWDPDITRGKRLQVKAFIKASNVDDYANFHLRIKDINQRLLADKKMSLHGTFGWKEMTLEADVPFEADSIVFGLTLESAGQIWIKWVRVGLL